MDSEEVRRVLFRRVESLDSENTLKIMGYLLLKGWGEKDMLELAISSDYALQSLVAEAKFDLGLTLPHFKYLEGRKYAHPSLDSNYFQDFNSFSGQMTRTHFDEPTVAGGYLQSPNTNASFLSSGKKQYFYNLSHNQNRNQNRDQNLNLNQNQIQNISLNLNLNQNQNLNLNHGLLTMSNNWSPHGAIASPRIISNGLNSNYPLISSSPEKLCPHFAWGFCKHGNNCRFLHGISSPPLLDDNSNNSLFLSPSSLECLKMELKELLQGRKNPVSIASLPQLYFEKYGKTLQAEGYLTESQRHGKSGFSLTKLLSKLNNTVMIIDRPHGQHAVMLIEEEPKLKESGETTVNDAFNGMNANSRQIYLTFPAESTFTEEDVMIHFRAYGPVQDVRIPYQQKRMFGFVTFMYSETVRSILVEGNPHYICGARVLVKPYKEKGKISDIKKSREREGIPSTQSNGFCYSLDHFARHYFPFSSAFQHNKNDQGEKLISDAMNARLDEQFLSLGRKIEEMKLDQNSNNEKNNITSMASASSLSYDELDEELNPMMPPDNAEDCFHLQSNIFRYVLDILDSDGKENDFVEQSDKHSNNQISSDLKMLADPFNYNIREVSNPTLKTNKAFVATEQISLGTGCNWSEPTLFASSVY